MIPAGNIVGASKGSGSTGRGSGMAYPYAGFTLAGLGDSRIANNGTTSGGTTILSNNGNICWFKTLCNQRMYLAPGSIFGYAGYTIQQVAAAGMAGVLAVNPDICIIQVGTNNLPTADTASTMVNALVTTILKPLIAANILPVMMIETPRGGITTAQQQKRVDYNNYLRELSFGRSDLILSAGFAAGRTLIVSDPTPMLSDATNGLPVAAYFQEASQATGLHPNLPGSFIEGQQLLIDLAPILPRRLTSYTDFFDAYDATNNKGGNLFSNSGTNYGLLQGTGGLNYTNSGVTPTGQVANNLQVYAQGVTSTMTIVNSKENPRQDGAFYNGERQVVQVTSTTSGGTDEQVRCGPQSLINPVTGDVIWAECTYTIDPGCTNVTALELYLLDTANSIEVSDMGWTNAGNGNLMPNGGISGTLRTDLLTITAGSPNIQCNVNLHMNTTLGATGGNCTFRIGDFQIKKAVAT